MGGQAVVGITFAVLRGTGRAVPCGKDDFTAQRVAVAGLAVADQFHAYPTLYIGTPVS